MNRRELVWRDEYGEWRVADTRVSVLWLKGRTSDRALMIRQSRDVFDLLLSFPDPRRAWDVGDGELDVQSNGTLYVSGEWSASELPALIAAMIEAQAHLEQWERDVEAWLEGDVREQ